MNETLAIFIKAVESGELLINSVRMIKSEERSKLPPWTPDEAIWEFTVVRVPEKYREPIDLAKEYLANIPSGLGRETDLTK